MDRGRRYDDDDRDLRYNRDDRDTDRGRDLPPRGRERSRSPEPRREDEEEVRNPGNNLYVSGLSSRTTERDLEDHFNREGRVQDCRLVVDPRSKESRGFAFVMMETQEDAERCIKYLDRSVLQGRVITVALAKRKRPRTPTPGKFLGVRPVRDAVSSRDAGYGGDRRLGYAGAAGGAYERDPYPPRRSPDYAPYRRNRSPDYAPYRGNEYYR